MKRRLLPLPFIFALLVAPLRFGEIEPAYACYCMTPEITDRVEQSDLIFVGSFNALQGVGGSASFTVDRYLKGHGASEMSLVDWMFGSDCSFGLADFVAQEEVVMFAEAQGGAFKTHLCSGNVRARYNRGEYDEVLAVTGPGIPPDNVVPQDEADDHEKDTPWLVILPLAFAIPLAVLLVPAFLRKRSAGH